MVSGQWSVVSGQGSGASERAGARAGHFSAQWGQWSVVSGQGSGAGENRKPEIRNPKSEIRNPKSLNPNIPRSLAPSPQPLAPRGFTLTELLVTISIIAILAGLTMGVLRVSRQMAAEAATKATIAKISAIVMKRYESYLTRRVPVSLSNLSPLNAAQDRLFAIRDIMRMEMPDRLSDVTSPPITLKNSGGSVSQPALNKFYNSRVGNWPTTDPNAPGNAYLLYMIVSMGSPEAMEQFSQSEISVDPTHNQWTYFVNGWGRPIFFLRWAPGYIIVLPYAPPYRQFSDSERSAIRSKRCRDRQSGVCVNAAGPERPHEEDIGRGP